jgi:uncharacterized DUF497 family protein
MKIEFDPHKDELNREKHGVSLAFGEYVLADPNLAVSLDLRFEYGEDSRTAW